MMKLSLFIPTTLSSQVHFHPKPRPQPYTPEPPNTQTLNTQTPTFRPSTDLHVEHRRPVETRKAGIFSHPVKHNCSAENKSANSGTLPSVSSSWSSTEDQTTSDTTSSSKLETRRTAMHEELHVHVKLPVVRRMRGPQGSTVPLF